MARLQQLTLEGQPPVTHMRWVTENGRSHRVFVGYSPGGLTRQEIAECQQQRYSKVADLGFENDYYQVGIRAETPKLGSTRRPDIKRYRE